MTIGAGVGLFVVGAILAFALTESQIGALEVQTLGYILMLAGVLVTIASLALSRRGARHETVTQTTAREPAPGETVERRTERRDGV